MIRRRARIHTLNRSESVDKTAAILAHFAIPHVYFNLREDKTGRFIRIGFSKDKKRNSTGPNTGLKLVAAIPASHADEIRLHNYFSPHSPLFHPDESHYDASKVEPYIKELLRHNRAVTEIRLLHSLGYLPYKLWSPEAMNKPVDYGHDGFFPPDIHTKKCDRWQTPAFIFALATEVLGGIQLDPASELEAYNRPSPEHRPKHFYTEHNNGLSLDWEGPIFLNPPYGDGDDGLQGVGAELFMNKWVQEIKAKRVTSGIAVLNLQSMCTIWFRRSVSNVDFAFAISKERIAFLGPSAKFRGTKYGSSKNGTVFLYYGPNKERFWRVFQSIAYPFQLIKAKFNDQ